MDHDRLRLVAGVIDDLDLTRLDDVELEVAIAHRDECLPVPIQLLGGVGATLELADLGVVERRESNGLKGLFGHGAITLSHRDAETSIRSLRSRSILPGRWPSHECDNEALARRRRQTPSTRTGLPALTGKEAHNA